MQTEDKLKELVIAAAKRESPALQAIEKQTDLLEDLGFDSIAMIKLVVDIENFFGFEFEDQMLDFEALTTFGALSDYVCSVVGDAKE